MKSRWIALLALAAASVSLGGATAQTLEKFRFAYSSNVPGADSTFLFAGKELGFFKEEGIDLEIQPSQGIVASTSLVASGAVDVSSGGLEALPAFIEKKVPVRAIYLYGDKTMFKLGFFKDSPIQKPSDLKGAKIGILSLGSGSVNVLQFLLKEAGLTQKDVTLIPVGSGQSALAAMKNKEIDALMYHDTGFVNFEANGIQFNMYSSPKLDAGYAGIGVWALESAYKGKRDLFVRFLRAYTKSLAYAARDPEGATRAFGRLHPEVAKNPKLEEAMWRERMKIMPVVGPGGVSEWGRLKDEKTAFENLLEVQMLSGLIKTKPPLDALFTSELIKDVNKVDLSKLP